MRIRPLWVAISVGLLMGLLPAVDALPAGATGNPSQLVFSSQPGDGDPGTALAAQPTVQIEDNSSAVVSTSSTVTLTLTGSGGAALTGPPPSLSCNQTTGGVTSISASSGVAAFTGCTVGRGGIFTFTATDSADHLTQHSSDFFVSGPAQLAFTGTEPNGGQATSAWTDQPQVSVEDGHGVVITGSTSAIHLAIKSGTGTSSANLSCTANPVSAVSGVAPFAGCAIDKVGTGYELVATDGTDSLISPPSNAFDVSAGAPASLAFIAQPTGGAGGAAFNTQPEVVVKDAGGNVIAGNADQISLSITTNTGTSGAKLTCTTNPVSAVDGVAKFGGCAIDDSGTGYELTATDSTASKSASTNAFNIGAGGAANIAFNPDPGGGAGGSAFGTQPVVTLKDAGGNPVAGSVTLSIKSGTGAPGATLSCATNPLAVDTSGAADFSGCSINDLGQGYVLTATSGSLSVDSTPFDVSTGGPAKASFTTDPGDGTGTGGSALTSQPVVSLTDGGGNQAAGAVTLSITPGTGSPGATLTCANNPVSTTAGSATFTGCSVDKAGTGYTLTATSGAATVTSKAFTVGLGSPARLEFNPQPGGGTGGTTWANQPVVVVEDAGGNQLPTSTASIALSVTPMTGSGMLHCDANSLPAVHGAAIFSGCSIDKTALAYTLTAKDAADNLSQTSAPFAVMPGPAAQLLFTAQPSGGIAGAVWSSQPVVAVADAGGNVTSSSSSVALSIAPGTGTAGAALACASNAVGASAGVAPFSGCSINQAGGGYTLVASDATDGLQVESLPLTVSTPPPGPLGVAPTGVPTAQTFGGSTYGVNPTDTNDDVNSATGALTFAVTDLHVAGIGEPLVLRRTYNSADNTGGSFGRGWTSILDASVTIVPNHTLTLRGEDGQQIVFSWNTTTKSWSAPPGAKAAVSCNPVRCTVTRFDGVTLTFNVATSGPSRLASYDAPDGQGLSFAWKTSSVVITVDTTNTTPYNVAATLDGSGHVTKVTTPAGRSVSYGYSGGVLSSVTDARGHVWTYAYNGSGLFTTEKDPGGNVRLTATYDSSNRVSWVSSEGSPQHTNDTFTYTGSSTTRGAQVNANGSLTRALYVDQYTNNVLVSQTAPWGGISRYSYDAQVDLTESQNALGWIQQLSYDANNNLVAQSTPISSTSAATVKMAYDDQHRLVSQTDADGNTTTYAYSGAALKFIYPPGATTAGRTQLNYNGQGELTNMVGPTGQKLFTYDAAGQQTSVVLQSPSGTALNGPGTKATYDEAGDVTSRTDANGNTTTYTYDAAGDLLTTVAPGPQTSSNTYSQAGDVTSVTDAAGNKTTYSWDEGSLTRTSVTNNGSPSTNVFDGSGDLLVESNAAGRSTTHVFDASEREIAKTDPTNVTTQYTYDLQGNIVRQSDNAGDVITYQFDGVNHPIRQVDNGAATLTSYDPAGNVISTTDPAGAVTTTAYTAHSKPASVTNAAGTTHYAYDAADDVVATTDPDGHVTNYTYDGAARRTSITTNGNTTSYAYDNNGNVKTTTDPDGRVTTNTYNALNLPTSTTYTQSGQPTLTVTQSYDALGHRTGMTDPDGTQHTYSYDVAGDLTKATSGTDTFTYDYSQPGKIVETYPDGTNVAYSVDDNQNLMSVQSGTSGSAGFVQASYIRNQLRETTGVSFSNGVFETQSVNQSGQVLDQSLQVAGTQIADNSFTYDANGNPLSQVDSALGTATTNQYSYDGSERLTGFTSSTAPSSIGASSTAAALTDSANTTTSTTATFADLTTSSSTSTSSPSGASTSTAASFAATTSPPSSSSNATSEVATSGAATSTVATSIVAPTSNPPNPGSSSSTSNATTSTPAAEAQLASLSTSAPTTSYSYDAAGNLLTLGSTSSTYNAANELTSQSGPGGTTTYAYDKNGDLTSSNGPNGKTTYTYNAADELVHVTTPSSAISYTYDGDGNRTSRTVGSNVTQYVWDVKGSYARLVIERSGGGALIRRYIYGDGPVAMQTPTATFFYHLDPQGSVSELSDANGNIVAAYTYDGYGNVTTTGSSPPANPLLYKDQYLDSASGLYNMRARNYDPTTGRFTQRDSVSMAVGTPDISPYAFVDDRPTVFTDPTGTTPTNSSYAVSYSPAVSGPIPQIAKGLADEAGNSATQTIPGTQTVTNTDVTKVAVKPVIYAARQLATYISNSINAKVAPVTKALANSTGEIAEVAEGASEVAGDAGAGLAGEAEGAEGAASAESASAADFLGPLLIVAGLALGTYLTVEACEHGPVSTCVGDAVGTAVGTGLGILCLAATEGLGAVACGMAAGAVSAALTEVISRYGPQIAAGVVSLYNQAAAGVSTAVTAITAGLVSAGDAISSVAISVGGAIATGFNEATTAISSGFQTAMKTLVNAGYSAEQLAVTLAHDFAQGVNQAIGTLVSFGYSIQNVADAAFNVFSTNAVQFATIMKNGFNYAADQIAGALKNFYGLADSVTATILKGVNFAVDQVATALENTYSYVAGQVAAGVASALNAAGYVVAQIGAALQQVFAETDKAMASVLQTLGAAAQDVANALVSVYHDIDSAVATALDFATYTYNQIASALNTVFDDIGQVTAGILKTLQSCTSNIQGAAACATAIASALETAYNFLDVGAAQVLENIGFVVNDVATALKGVFKDIDTQVATAFRFIGNTVTQIGTALSAVFSDPDSAVATALRFVGYGVDDVATAIRNVFFAAVTGADAAVAAVLQGVGYAVTDVATAIANVFIEGAQDVATVLKGLFDINDVSTALELVFSQGAQDAAQILKNIGYFTSDIAGALKSIFQQGAADAAQILKNIGEAAADIATALENIFSEAVNDIGNILSDIGFSSADIQAVGAALGSAWSSLESFGQSVGDCITSGFTDC